MTKKKLAPAKDWRNRDIEDWTVLTFTEYLKDKHEQLFGIPYVPFGGTWGKEQGDLGSLIGTKSRTNPKPRKVSNEVVKRFIDMTFESYKPSRQYPGTSFGFMWSYRKYEWQQILASENEIRRKSERSEKPTQAQTKTEVEDLTEFW